jgi:hypothetical protein
LAVGIFLGTLVTIMLLIAPLCHPHYFCHWLPLVTGLVAWDLDRRPGRKGIGRGLFWVLVGNLAANALTSVPGLELLRDRGLATAAGLVLWAAGVGVLWWGAPSGAAGSSVGRLPRAAPRHNEAVMTIFRSTC